MALREIRWEGVDWKHLAQDKNQCRADVEPVTKLDYLSNYQLLKKDFAPWSQSVSQLRFYRGYGKTGNFELNGSKYS
jgi:hypothetical protein